MCCVKRALTAELVMEAVAAVHLKVSAVRGCARERVYTYCPFSWSSFIQYLCMYACMYVIQCSMKTMYKPF